MSNLQEVMIESESAHFKENPAPRLRVIHSPGTNPCFEEYSRNVRALCERFHRILLMHEKSNLNFEERWGFQVMKYLLDEIAEYILLCKKEGKRLNGKQVQELRNHLKIVPEMEYFLDGARLGILLEGQDPLSDAELFYLLNDQANCEQSNFFRGSYPEHRLMELLSYLEDRCQNSRTGLVKTSMQLACGFALPLFLAGYFGF